MADQLNKANKTNPIPGTVPVSTDNQWSQVAPVGQEPIKPGKKFSRNAGVLLAVGALIVISLFLFFVYRGKNKPKPEHGKTNIDQILSKAPLASVNPGASPPVLPAIKDNSKRSSMENYFKNASPQNYKAEFLLQVPDAAADSYLKYSSEKDSVKKKDEARGFYIILNNPAVNRNDPQFLKFMQDVRMDLEKEVGPLF